MNRAFVIDSSVAFGWVYSGQANDLTANLLTKAKEGSVLHVPSLWRLEIANALLAALRRRLLTEAHRQSGLALLSALKLEVDHETSSRAFSTISDLAAKHSLSAYDAAYLELARRKSLPLASRDEALKAAAKESGVSLLQ